MLELTPNISLQLRAHGADVPPSHRSPSRPSGTHGRTEAQTRDPLTDQRKVGRRNLPRAETHQSSHRYAGRDDVPSPSVRSAPPGQTPGEDKLEAPDKWQALRSIQGQGRRTGNANQRGRGGTLVLMELNHRHAYS